MKGILTTILIFISAILLAQHDKVPKPIQYCLITVTEAQAKPLIKTDFGRDTSFLNTWKQNGVFDDKGNFKKFQEPLDAFNWMNSQGWDFVSIVNNPARASDISRCLLRKKIKP